MNAATVYGIIANEYGTTSLKTAKQLAQAVEKWTTEKGDNAKIHRNVLASLEAFVMKKLGYTDKTILRIQTVLGDMIVTLDKRISQYQDKGFGLTDRQIALVIKQLADNVRE